MNRRLIGLVIILACAFSNCKKDKYASPIPPSGPTNPQNGPLSSDKPLLKDIVAPHLPSPYYHFEYDTAGVMIKAAFASDFFMYDLVYDQGRLSEVQNNTFVNKDKMKYIYDSDGRIAAVNYAHEDKRVFRRCFLTFNADQLQKIEWELWDSIHFVPERTLTFTYQQDGNITEMKDQRFAVGNQTSAVTTDRYEGYDDKINKDGFDIIKPDFFDHILLLPRVTFQKNNPRKITHTGDGVNYTVNYSYTYNNNNVPTNRTGDFVYTNGNEEGKHYVVGENYTYY